MPAFMQRGYAIVIPFIVLVVLTASLVIPVVTLPALPTTPIQILWMSDAVVPSVLPVIPPPPVRPSSSVLCLAQTMFFEASIEPMAGIQAVAATVFNRSDQSSWPSAICDVIYQPYQYSWTLIGSNWSRRPPQEFIDLAKTYIANRAILIHMYNATHFHRVDITPAWASSLEYVGTYGSHAFYTGAS